MKLTLDVRSPSYNRHSTEARQWAERTLPDKGLDTFRIDIIDEGVIRAHRYVKADTGKFRFPLETYTEELTGVEMPSLEWFKEE